MSEQSQTDAAPGKEEDYYEYVPGEHDGEEDGICYDADGHAYYYDEADDVIVYVEEYDCYYVESDSIHM
jgi:uncharacterized protein YneR